MKESHYLPYGLVFYLSGETGSTLLSGLLVTSSFLLLGLAMVDLVFHSDGGRLLYRAIMAISVAYSPICALIYLAARYLHLRRLRAVAERHDRSLGETVVHWTTFGLLGIVVGGICLFMYFVFYEFSRQAEAL